MAENYNGPKMGENESKREKNEQEHAKIYMWEREILSFVLQDLKNGASNRGIPLFNPNSLQLVKSLLHN